LVDEQVDIAGGAQADIAVDGLGEGKAFEDAERDAAIMEILRDAAEFGEAAQGVQRVC
jgi:hypothetical protein